MPNIKNTVTISLMVFILAIVVILSVAVFNPSKTTSLSANINSPTSPANKPILAVKSVKPAVVASNKTITFRDDEGEGDDNVIAPSPTVTPPIPPVPAPTPVSVSMPTPTPAGITAAQVATHNSPNDCWLIINNKVYNVTSYIPIHPGGPGQIIPYCGEDATTAFDTKNGRGSHSQNAQNILSNYYVGNLI